MVWSPSNSPEDVSTFATFAQGSNLGKHYLYESCTASTDRNCTNWKSGYHQTRYLTDRNRQVEEFLFKNTAARPASASQLIISTRNQTGCILAGRPAQGICAAGLPGIDAAFDRKFRDGIIGCWRREGRCNHKEYENQRCQYKKQFLPASHVILPFDSDTPNRPYPTCCAPIARQGFWMVIPFPFKVNGLLIVKLGVEKVFVEPALKISVAPSGTFATACSIFW
jgi:hypothetical protein